MKVVWHPGTGTFLALEECLIIDVPDDTEDIFDYLTKK